jgi:hypothetical protein
MNERPKRIRSPTPHRVLHRYPEPDEPPISGIRVRKPTRRVLQRFPKQWFVLRVTTDDAIERDQIA